MRKIVTMVLASMTLLFVSFTSSMAEWTAGISVSHGLYEASGSEQLKTGSGADANKAGRGKTTRRESATFTYPTIFVEYNIGMLSVGVDVIPGSVETDEAQRTDIGVGDLGLTTGNDTNAVQKASVELSKHITLYALVPIMETGAFVKAGIHRMNVTSKDSLATGSTYPDAEGVSGATFGLGYQHDTGGGFVRAELGYSKYENISLTATNTTNKVEADIRGGFARISIGRTF